MKMLKKIKTDMWINVFMMLLIGIMTDISSLQDVSVTRT